MSSTANKENAITAEIFNIHGTANKILKILRINLIQSCMVYNNV